MSEDAPRYEVIVPEELQQQDTIVRREISKGVHIPLSSSVDTITADDELAPEGTQSNEKAEVMAHAQNEVMAVPEYDADNKARALDNLIMIDLCNHGMPVYEPDSKKPHIMSASEKRRYDRGIALYSDPKMFNGLFDTLDEREKFIMERRLGLIGDGKGLSNKDIGIELGLSGSRVQKIADNVFHRKILSNIQRDKSVNGFDSSFIPNSNNIHQFGFSDELKEALQGEYWTNIEQAGDFFERTEGKVPLGGQIFREKPELREEFDIAYEKYLASLLPPQKTDDTVAY